jgi:hypothetical protein
MDHETARRILARVPYASRFPVGSLVPPVGLLQSTVRSLGELELALRPEPASLAGVNLDRLAGWIENDVGDPACAAAVRDVARAAPSYAEACQAIYQLVHERVASARQFAGSAPQSGIPEPDTR